MAEKFRAFAVRADWVSAYEASHALKGVAGNLALPAIHELSEKLNEKFKARQEDGLSALLDTLAVAIDTARISIAQFSLDLAGQKYRQEFSPEDADDLPPALAEQLRAVLDTDDPDLAEPVINQLSGTHPAAARQLSALIADFDFERARGLVADWRSDRAS